MHQCEDVFGLLDVAQPLGSEVAQCGAGGHPVACLLDRRGRQERLSTRCQRLEARSTKERAAVEALVLHLHVSAAQRDPDPEASDLAPIGSADPRLELSSRRDRSTCVAEGGVRAVADALEDSPFARSGARLHDHVVSRQRGAGRRAVALGEPGAALDIGEEEGQVARRRLLRIGHDSQCRPLTAEPGKRPNDVRDRAAKIRCASATPARGRDGRRGRDLGYR
jgi:hypothetical protein